MLESSQTLISQYNSGNLRDKAKHQLSYWSGYTIVSIDEKEVFGFYYHKKHDGTLDRTFFRTVTREHEELGTYFDVKGTREFLKNYTIE